MLKPSNKSIFIKIQEKVLKTCLRIQSSRADISSMRWKMISMVGDGSVLLVINVSIGINCPMDTSLSLERNVKPWKRRLRKMPRTRNRRWKNRLRRKEQLYHLWDMMVRALLRSRKSHFSHGRLVKLRKSRKIWRSRWRRSKRLKPRVRILKEHSEESLPSWMVALFSHIIPICSQRMNPYKKRLNKKLQNLKSTRICSEVMISKMRM